MLDFFLIANYWTNGILFTAITVMTALIVFAIAKYSNQPTTNGMIGATFSGFFIALFFWLMPFQGQPSISEYVPVLFAVLLGITLLLKIRE
jgi:hypothetical protein